VGDSFAYPRTIAEGKCVVLRRWVKFGCTVEDPPGSPVHGSSPPTAVGITDVRESAMFELAATCGT
jgi:hypothetical protein